MHGKHVALLSSTSPQAGQSRMVPCPCAFCTAQALVDVLRQYIADGVPLEAAFSRARSFSKKMKRAGGKFVPRGSGGMAKPEDAAAPGKH